MLSCRGISCVGEVQEVFAGGRARVEGGYKASDGCLMDLEANTHTNDRSGFGARVQPYLAAISMLSEENSEHVPTGH